MAETRAPLLAVLIDADNISPKWAEAIFDEIALLGEASVRRIYGDFSGNNLKKWSDQISSLAIVPFQQFANTVGKNSTDIALVIDAMDLLHTDRFDGFCLVTSDSDFTRLASRIREQGLDVYGFGERKTPVALRNAYKRFIYVENLVQEAADADSTKAAKPDAASDAVPLILKAMKELSDDDGWITLSPLGQQMLKLEPDFDARTYGSAKLSTLIEKTGLFELDRTSKPMRMRERPLKKTTKKKG